MLNIGYNHPEYLRLLSCDFEPLKRGDLILNTRSGLLSQIPKTGFLIELYIGSGLTLSADAKIRIKSLYWLFDNKHNFYVFSRNDIEPNDRCRIISEAFIYWGKFYDVKGIFGQFLEFITGRKRLSNKTKSKHKVNSSELIWKAYNNSGIALTNSKTANITPNYIYDWCIRSSRWERVYKFLL